MSTETVELPRGVRFTMAGQAYESYVRFCARRGILPAGPVDYERTLRRCLDLEGRLRGERTTKIVRQSR